MNGTGTTKSVMQPRTTDFDALDTRLIRYAKARVRTSARGLLQIMRLLQVASILVLYKNLQSNQQNNADGTQNSTGNSHTAVL